MHPLDGRTAAFARMREARAFEVASARWVNCAGCKAYHMGGNWGWAACQELRVDGTCPIRAHYGLGPARIEVVVDVETVEVGDA